MSELTLDQMVAELDAMAEQQDEQDSAIAFSDPDDPVQAMQALLLKHEGHVAQVEDPDLIRALSEIRALAYSNISDLFSHVEHDIIDGIDDQGEPIVSSFERLSVVDITRLPRHVSAAIKKVKITRRSNGDQIEVEMYDKLVSLDKLMRYHGAYERDNAQSAAANQGALDLILASIGGGGLPKPSDNAA